MSKMTLAERIRGFKVDISKITLTDLEVAGNSELVVSFNDAKYRDHLSYLEPSSIDDVKKWLGNPDTALAQSALGARTIASSRDIAPSRAPLPTTLPAAIIQVRPNFSEAESRDLHELSRAYVYGHSASVDKRQLPALDAWIKMQKIRIPALIFKDIIVSAGATLHINTKILFANHITVQHTGKIKLKGGSKTAIHASGFTGKTS